MTNTETFITKSLKVHGENYEYSKVKYVNNYTDVKIICRSHGLFEQLPKNHLVGKGCPDCSIKNRSFSRFDFIKKAKKIHGKKYTYQSVSYKNNQTDIIITCREHGNFEQLPKHHLVGKGCPNCNFTSTGESMISVILDEYEIPYHQEFPLVKNPNTGCFLRADFYIDSINTVIEFDGAQHFKPINYFGGEEHYRQCVQRDEIKNKYCKKNKINIIRIPYFQKNEIRSILEKIIFLHYKFTLKTA
jgi:rubrerythrin